MLDFFRVARARAREARGRAYAAADPRDERDIDHKDRAARPRVDKEEVLAANILDGGERQLDAQQEQAVQPEEEHHKRLGEFEGDEC